MKYDGNRNLIEITDPLGNEAKDMYTPKVNVKKVNARGNSKHFFYDEIGRVSEQKMSLGIVFSFHMMKILIFQI